MLDTAVAWFASLLGASRRNAARKLLMIGSGPIGVRSCEHSGRQWLATRDEQDWSTLVLRHPTSAQVRSLRSRLTLNHSGSHLLPRQLSGGERVGNLKRTTGVARTITAARMIGPYRISRTIALIAAIVTIGN